MFSQILKFPYILIVIILLVGGVIALSWKHPTTSPQMTPPSQYANSIVSKCSSSSYHPSCFDEEIPKLMDAPSNLSLEQAFEVTREVQNQDSSYRYCHVLGHELGAKETKKDPNRWKEVITMCPDGVCSNGCIHGALMERFKGESLSNEQIEGLKSELINVCDKREGWDPTLQQKNVCFHGLGHLVMYATGADIKKSIELCNIISSQDQDDDFSRPCFDGLFMQIFQPLEPEDFDLIRGIAPTREQTLNFCSQYPTKVRGSCMTESWPTFAQEIAHPDSVINFCSYTKDQTEVRRCYLKLIGIATNRLYISDPNIADRIAEFCSSLPSQDNQDKRCLATAARRLVRNDIEDGQRAAEICQKAKGEASDYCFTALSAYGKKATHFGSTDFKQYCSSLPNPWNKKCLEGSLQYDSMQ